MNTYPKAYVPDIHHCTTVQMSCDVMPSLNSCAVMYVWDIRLRRVPSGHMTFEQLCGDVCLGHTPSEGALWSHDI